jgi:hypothetical protein
VREVGLNDVDGNPPPQGFEIVPGEQPLARREGDSRVCSDRRERVVVFGEHRLLDEHRLVGLERFDQSLGHRLGDAAAEIDADLDLVADRLADAPETIGGPLDDRGRVDTLHLGGRVHLQCAETRIDLLGGGRADLGGAIAADPLIDADSVAGATTEQLVNRRAEAFALDVPERLIDPGDSAHQNRTAPVEPPAIHPLPVVLDTTRVLPEQVAIDQFLDRRADGLRAALDDRLTPADDTVVGLQAQEQPPRGVLV